MLTDDDVKRLQKVIVEPLEKRMVSVENKIDHLADRVGSVEERVESVENKVDSLTSDVAELKINVEAIHIIVTEDNSEFDKRIQRLEKHSGITP